MNQNNLGIPFSAFADHHHTLVVRRPSNVFNWTTKRMELIFEYVFFVHSIPNPNFARLICGKYNICFFKGFDYNMLQAHPLGKPLRVESPNKIKKYIIIIVMDDFIFLTTFFILKVPNYYWN